MKLLLMILSLTIAAAYLQGADQQSVTGRKVALVVGNNNYPASPLSNCVSDAAAVASLLRDKLHFDLVLADKESENLGRLDFSRRLQSFQKEAQGASVVLFYYAGHGMEDFDGRDNYIIPVDANLAEAAKDNAGLQSQGIALEQILRGMNQVTRGAKIILLDCCRERPSERTIQIREGGGLVMPTESDLPQDTLIMLAASPSRTASDGEIHGPFTSALLKHLPKPGTPLLQTFRSVRNEVVTTTEGHQKPWLKLDGAGDFFYDHTLVSIGNVPPPDHVLPPVAGSPVNNSDWKAFRGPTGNGVVPALPGATWSLKLVWKAPTNLGFSSFAVAGGKAYTVVTGEADGNTGEMLSCLDATSGREVWSKPLSVVSKYDGGGDAGTSDNKGGDGSRSTPVIDGGKVYIIDSLLHVFAFDAATGEKAWDRDVIKQHSGEMIKWHNAASPLIDGDVLMLAGGGEGQALIGLNKDTGKVVWKGEDDKMTHATPVLADILGVHQAIFFTQKGLVGVAPSSGKVLWRADFPYKVSTAASPVVFEDIVYCSAGYGVGAGAFKLSKDGSGLKAEQIWRRENECFNHWSTPIVKDGYLYGMFSFKEYGAGPLACVDIRTGEDKWKEPGFGPGQVILAGDKIIATSDKGEIVIAEAKPDKYKEVKRQDVLDGKVWSYPVLAGGKLFARSTVEGVCLTLE